MSVGDYILVDQEELGFDPAARPGRVSPEFRPWVAGARVRRDVASEQAALMWGQTQAMASRPIAAGVVLRPVGQPIYGQAPPGTYPPGQCCPEDPLNLAYTDVTSDSLDVTPLNERLIEGDLLGAMSDLGALRGMGALSALADENNFKKAYDSWRRSEDAQQRQSWYSYAKGAWSKMAASERRNWVAEMQTMASNMGDASINVSAQVRDDPSLTSSESLRASQQRADTAAAELARARARGGESMWDHFDPRDALPDIDAGDVKKAVVAVVVVGGLAAGLAAFLHGRGMRRNPVRRQPPKRRRRR